MITDNDDGNVTYWLSSNAYSLDTQINDVLDWALTDPDVAAHFRAEFPEYATLTWDGAWVQTAESGVDPEYMGRIADWIETHLPASWTDSDGEPAAFSPDPYYLP